MLLASICAQNVFISARLSDWLFVFLPVHLSIHSFMIWITLWQMKKTSMIYLVFNISFLLCIKYVTRISYK